jgi:hypothetical protein
MRSRRLHTGEQREVRRRVDVYTFAAAGATTVHLSNTPTSCPHDLQFIVGKVGSSDIVQGYRSLCDYDATITLPDPAASYTITINSPEVATAAYTFQLTR